MLWETLGRHKNSSDKNKVLKESSHGFHELTRIIP